MPNVPDTMMVLNNPPIQNNDNTATRLGFTVHKVIEIGGYEFAALCHPDTDFDARFKCFNTDDQEWLIVNGWLADNITDAD
jgi:hypothetical protein